MYSIIVFINSSSIQREVFKSVFPSRSRTDIFFCKRNLEHFVTNSINSQVTKARPQHALKKFFSYTELFCEDQLLCEFKQVK